MSSAITIADLQSVLRTDLGVIVDEETLADPDATFEALDVDSLALFELCSVVEQRFGVVIPDELIPDLKGPADLLGHVGHAVQAGV